jgi:hypothetical protein
MRRLAIPVLVSLALAAPAHAGTPFDVLAVPKTSWTYDVVAGRKHKPTGVRATLTVTAVHTVGAYTVTELESSLSADDKYSFQLGTWIVGPDGLREVPFFDAAETGYTEAFVAEQYQEHYVPRAYLQSTPAKQKRLHWKLDRFGDEDRDYDVTGAITRPDAHTWRTAWKGKYEIPENGEREKYTWSTDYDPAIGFTQICTEDGVCLRLVAP